VPVPTLTAARNAVGLTFFLNGLVFASWVSRIPEVRSSFDLTNGRLGLVLLAIAVGSVVALPTTGALINRWGTVVIVRAGAAAATVGMLTAALGLGNVLPMTVAGLFVYGLGIGVWDVAMNVEGAEVERGLARTIMPRFHAGFSGGTVVGALLGVLLIELDVPAVAHLVVIVLLAVGLVWWTSPSFLPVAEQHEDHVRVSAARAWLEPRTLLIGVMVLALAMTEGTANDWLAVALVDGHDVSHAMGVAGFAVFVAAMTAGRFAGTGLIDRFGRVLVLWGTMALAGAGVLLIVFAAAPAWVVVGIVLWGVGASLGFPVGMSAAADDPGRAAARVSVVSTIGYAAFLAGPPFLGFVGDEVGTLKALLVVAVLLMPAALVVPSARERRTDPVGASA
jgi:fucose permease